MEPHHYHPLLHIHPRTTTPVPQLQLNTHLQPPPLNHHPVLRLRRRLHKRRTTLFSIRQMRLLRTTMRTCSEIMLIGAHSRFCLRTIQVVCHDLDWTLLCFPRLAYSIPCPDFYCITAFHLKPLTSLSVKLIPFLSLQTLHSPQSHNMPNNRPRCTVHAPPCRHSIREHPCLPHDRCAPQTSVCLVGSDAVLYRRRGAYGGRYGCSGGVGGGCCWAQGPADLAEFNRDMSLRFLVLEGGCSVNHYEYYVSVELYM